MNNLPKHHGAGPLRRGAQCSRIGLRPALDLYSCIITPAWMKCRIMIYLMDSGTCAKSLRNPDLHINELGRRMDFPRGGGGISGVVISTFREGPTVVKFYFTNSKLKKNIFQISNSSESKVSCTPLLTLIRTRINMYKKANHARPALS